jgi:hypothetical protein
MKNLKSFAIILFLFIGGSIWFTSCSDETDMDPDLPDDPINEKVDPDQLLDRFVIKNASKIDGTLQVPENITGFNSKLNRIRDSLFIHQGINFRLQVKFPEKTFSNSSGFYFQISGGKKYLDIKTEDRESNDSVGVFYMDFDPDGLEFPISFKAKIVPYSVSGAKLSTLETIVTILDPDNKTCDLVHPKNTWRWMYTIRDGMVELAPGFGERVTTHVTGCCSVNGESINCLEHFIPESDWIRLEGISTYLINHEILEFSDSGITGALQEYVQNLNPKPEVTNFCTGDLEYLISIRDNEFWGDYTFDASSGILQFKNLESKVTFVELFGQNYPQYDKMFINVSAKYEVFGCHYLMETSNIEGSATIRIFERVGDLGDE